MQSELDPQEIVDDCEDMYQDAYHDVAKRDRDGLVLSDLQRDLVKMSNQPAIKYEFRRFVIIKSPEDVHGRPGEEDWVSDRGAVFHYQAADIFVVSSVSGSWLLSSSSGMRVRLRISHVVYYNARNFTRCSRILRAGTRHVNGSK